MIANPRFGSALLSALQTTSTPPAAPNRAEMLSQALTDAVGAPAAMTAPRPPAIPPAASPAPSGGGKGRLLLGVLGDALLGAAGKAPVFAPMMEQRRREDVQLQAQAAEWGRMDRQRAEDRQWQVEDRDFKANQPETFTSGRDRVRYDPRTGESSVVYDGQEDFEVYADAMGLDRDTPEYQDALKDYVLRGNGPTAFKYDQGLEALRNAQRIALRATPTYAQAHPRPTGGGRGRTPTLSSEAAGILAKVKRGETLTPGEERAWSMYRAPSSRSRGSRGTGGQFSRVAQDAKGNKVGWNGKAWVPID
jgi:hypothetical protein